jgi:uncharacterized membrane protein
VHCSSIGGGPVAAANKEPEKAVPRYTAGSGRRLKPTMLEPILIVAIVIAATTWYVQHKWRKRLRAAAIRDRRGGNVLELLARRYASGEIDREEYLQKRSDILDYQGMPPRS